MVEGNSLLLSYTCTTIGPSEHHMDSSTTVPFLPPELERIIFLHAAYTDIKNVSHYLVVAKRVQNWVMGAVFEVMVLHSKRMYPKEFTLDQLKEYGHHVQHLLLSNWAGDLTVAQYLTFCPNIENLALWTGVYSDDTIQAISHLSLKRLSIDITQLSEPDILTPQLISAFANITHLDLANAILMWTQCEALIHFRSLTHLAIFYATETEVLKTILERVEGLKVIIWLSGSISGLGETPEGAPEEVEDIRIVALECSYVKDWEDGARGEEDMWTLSDKIVEARRERSQIS
ncbi:hypothetical protein BDN72DRAFT_126969 [Pluteus cervinus]|uniref:Uncharacterized protein n=1 Tax=Pluteus cervinus TaxID=181527 RepID=A0ACD3ALV2_9AGAR|nr:hypothetical protein BDN72DRAFT_126969 [Pluteus cervinus]